MRRQLKFTRGFHVALTHARTQAATMNLAPGGKEGGPDNFHRGSDQWLFVLEGTGKAVLDGRSRPLKAGTLLLIERGVRHEVRNTGETVMKTINVYSPPAYRKDGEPLPPGKGKVRSP
ncbi:MAG: tetracenomycin polyketide synthesis protein [Fibrobacteria bacterium]|jgi:mannose-6-phosphate isomerase-like protein (cupin superfamily)|nr:tetracenomycin polyketide synthesis protein [Fibrobacteria bacterium]